MHKHLYRVGFLLALVILVGGGCKKEAPTPVANVNEQVPVAQTIDGHDWVWVRTDLKDGARVTPRKASAFVVTFGGDGRLTGTTDCNSFFGGYEAVEGALMFPGPFGATKMFCEGSQEGEFMTMIGDAVGYSFAAGGGLVLSLKDDGGTMQFAERLPVSVSPVSHAAFALTWGDVTIYNDPTASKGFAGMDAADIVLVSDIHGDHYNAPALVALVGADTTFVAPQAVIDQLPAELGTRVTKLANGDSIEKNGITIAAMPMYNLPETAESRHTKGRGNGYVLEKEGFRVYIAGDTAGIPEMRAMKEIDVAFVPMNGPTMTVEEAADAVLAFAPRRVYPYHYRSQGGFSDVAKFKELVRKGNPKIEVVLLEWYPPAP